MMTHHNKASGITKKGVIELLKLNQLQEDDKEYRADLQNLINELEVSDPKSREFGATYQEITYSFSILIKIRKEGEKEDRYEFETSYSSRENPIYCCLL